MTRCPDPRCYLSFRSLYQGLFQGWVFEAGETGCPVGRIFGGAVLLISENQELKRKRIAIIFQQFADGILVFALHGQHSASSAMAGNLDEAIMSLLRSAAELLENAAGSLDISRVQVSVDPGAQNERCLLFAGQFGKRVIVALRCFRLTQQPL